MNPLPRVVSPASADAAARETDLNIPRARRRGPEPTDPTFAALVAWFKLPPSGPTPAAAPMSVSSTPQEPSASEAAPFAEGTGPTPSLEGTRLVRELAEAEESANIPTEIETATATDMLTETVSDPTALGADLLDQATLSEPTGSGTPETVEGPGFSVENPLPGGETAAERTPAPEQPPIGDPVEPIFDTDAGNGPASLTADLEPGFGSTTTASVVPRGPTEATRVLDQIVSQAVPRLPVVSSDVPTQMTVRLDPPELGQVLVQLRKTERGITMRVHAADPTTRSLLERHAPELRQALEQFETPVGLQLESAADFDSSLSGESRDRHLGERRSDWESDGRRGATLVAVSQETLGTALDFRA